MRMEDKKKVEERARRILHLEPDIPIKIHNVELYDHPIMGECLFFDGTKTDNDKLNEN